MIWSSDHWNVCTTSWIERKLTTPLNQIKFFQVHDSIKPRKPFPRRDTSESMQPEFCDEEIIPPLPPLIQVKTSGQTDTLIDRQTNEKEKNILV